MECSKKRLSRANSYSKSGVILSKIHLILMSATSFSNGCANSLIPRKAVVAQLSLMKLRISSNANSLQTRSLLNNSAMKVSFAINPCSSLLTFKSNTWKTPTHNRPLQQHSKNESTTINLEQLLQFLVALTRIKTKQQVKITIQRMKSNTQFKSDHRISTAWIYFGKSCTTIRILVL